MKKTALTIMIITIISKIVGFCREIVLSFLYGATSISDAYLIALTIPGVIFSFIAAGLSAGYIPMYSNIMQNEGASECNNFTSNLLNIILLISSIVIIIGIAFTEPIVRMFAAGFEGETLELAIKLTKISLFAIYFSGMASVFTSFLQVKGNFAIPALLGLPLNVIVILSLVISQYTNLSVLAIGYVFAIGSQIVFMFPFMKNNNFKYKCMMNFKDEHIASMTRVIMPLVLSVSANQINVLVDRTIASRVVVGGISALNFANRLNSFVQGIFVLSVVTAIYPLISKMAAEENLQGLKKSLVEAITVINLFVIPATVGFVLFAKQIVSLLFGRGAFDDVAINMTSSALVFYSVGMIGFGLRDILTRAFYSLQDTKTPMINGITGVLINIILNLILSQYMGIGGLALATSISAIVTTALLFRSLRHKIGSFNLGYIIMSFIKILLASLLMGIISKSSYILFESSHSNNTSLLFSICVGVITYFVVIYFMKINDADVIFKAVKKKLINLKNT